MITDSQTQTFFEKIKSLFANDMATAQARIKDLEAQTTAGTAALAEANTALTGAKARADKAEAELKAAQAALAEAKAAADPEKRAKEVAAAAAALAAAAGQPPVAQPKNDDQQTAQGEDLIARLNALQRDPERAIEATQFYRANRNAIDAAYRARK